MASPAEVAVGHPNCPDTVILENWANPKVRFNAAQNTGISETIQQRYLTNPDQIGWAERNQLAVNPAVTTNTLTMWIPLEENLDTLRILLAHPNMTPELKTVILARLIANAPTSAYDATETRFAIIVHSTNETEILNALYPNGDTSKRLNNSILKRVLTNRACPESVVVKACYSDSRKVRRNAMHHPNCPEEGRVIAGLQE